VFPNYLSPADAKQRLAVLNCHGGQTIRRGAVSAHSGDDPSRKTEGSLSVDYPIRRTVCGKITCQLTLTANRGTPRAPPPSPIWYNGQGDIGNF